MRLTNQLGVNGEADMRGMGISAATGATLLALVAAARAETPVGAADADVSQNGRFQMTPAPDGPASSPATPDI